MTVRLLAVLVVLAVLAPGARAAEGDAQRGVVNLQFKADAREVLQDNEVAVVGLFDASSADQKGQRAAFRRVGESEEFAGVGVVLADSTEARVREFFGVDEADTPWVRVFRDFGPDGEGHDNEATPFTVDYDGEFAFSELKSFVFRESLPPVLRLGGGSGLKSGRWNQLAARSFMAFRQVTFSKFMVVHDGPYSDEVEAELLAFALKYRHELIVITVDLRDDAGRGIGESVLRMGGLTESAVQPGMDRPIAVMIGDTGTLQFDGTYEPEPMDWFVSDWKEQGAGGCNGTWWEKPRKRSKKKAKSKKKKEL